MYVCGGASICARSCRKKSTKECASERDARCAIQQRAAVLTIMMHRAARHRYTHTHAHSSTPRANTRAMRCPNSRIAHTHANNT